MLVVKNKKWNTPGVFDQFLNHDLHQLLGSDYRSSMPAVNVIENQASYEIEVAAPGLAKEDLQVSIEKDVLTISAEKKTSTENKNGNYLKREFSYHSFKRKFNVPEHADTNAIKASYENGVLKVVLPKKEKNDDNTSKTIAVS